MREVELAGRVLDEVRAVAGRRAEAEVLVESSTLALTRFARSYIHQNVADTGTVVRLRLHLDGRTATGSTTLTIGEALHDLVERTRAASLLCPPDTGWPGLAPPAERTGFGTVDEATANASPADRAAAVRDFVDAAAGLETAGYCRTLSTVAAFANSEGQFTHGASTGAAMDGIARTGTSDGVARRSGLRLADLRGGELGAVAATKARAGAAPVELAPGRYEVVLEPSAARDVLEHLGTYGFNGRACQEKRSFLRPGEAQFDPAVTIVDDPLGAGAGTSAGAGVSGSSRAATYALPFDVEGTPKRRREFVVRGVSQGPAHDRRTAAAAGTESTGHAWSESERLGPTPLHLRLEPGEGEDGETGETDGLPVADGSVAALVAGVSRGLLVTDFWYTRVLDPRTVVMTGLTRNGVWLIEDGEITTPVRNLRFTQSYPQAMAPGAVLGVGSAALAVPYEWGTDSAVTPALRLAAWNFTGGASG